MEYQDKTLNCIECGGTFTFTATQQQYHQEKGYTSEPKRCPPCRAARKSAMPATTRVAGPGPAGSGGGPRGDRSSFEAVCAECGQKASVPFRPNPDRPVYCDQCFRKHRQGRPGGSRHG
ncbi:MAG: zinc-ribbon domain containing protein [Planctomycetes bacterium]|nr:zinc-ribbon domain containing protein [Planctomycetota bacterium]